MGSSKSMQKAGMFNSATALHTKNPLTRALGLSGEQGEFYQPGAYQNYGLTGLETEASALQDSGVSSQINEYLKSGNLDKYLENLGSGPYAAASRGVLATDPIAGSRLATSEVQRNPILGKLFGEGGALGRSLQEEKELASRGYSLQPEDYEAYGQASGQLARAFGQQEQNLAQSLAARGLAQGPSGAASAQFAGLGGNKFEQLAGLQRQIADQRMQRNMDRLAQTRNYAATLGQQGANAIQDQYGRQASGVQMRRDAFSEAAAAKDRQYGMQEGLAQQSLADKRAQKGKTLLDALGSGLYSATEAAPGVALGMATGGAGGVDSRSAAGSDPRKGTSSVGTQSYGSGGGGSGGGMYTSGRRTGAGGSRAGSY